MNGLRLKFRVSFAIAVVTALSACGDGDSTGPGNGVANTNFEASEDFSFTVAVTSQTSLIVNGINGNVEVTGSAAATEVTVAGTKRVKSESVEDARDNLSRLTVNASSTSTAVFAETTQPAETGGRTFIVDYRITVPASLRVEVSNLNGNVHVQQTVSNVEVVNLNGNVDLDEVAGIASVTLTNGNIDIDDHAGSVGAITTNGNVQTEAVLPLNGTLDLASTNGNVQITVPQNTSADVTASLANGQIRVSNLTLSNLVQTPTSLSGTLGAGEGTIDLTTVNGDVDLIGL